MSRLLIVDDSQTVLTFLQAILESEHYEVVTASDGTMASRRSYQTLPDLIITDSVMPGLDGFGLLRALRGDPATETVPVIMLTSGEPDDPDHAALRAPTRCVCEEIRRFRAPARRRFVTRSCAGSECAA